MIPTWSIIRVVDNRPQLRPGGARGAPPPMDDVWPEGRPIACWLTSGDVVHVETAGEGDARPGLSWEMVDWWIPA